MQNERVPGPRVKQTIETAGDVAYQRKLLHAAVSVLAQRLDAYRVAQLQAWRDEYRELEDARQWIARHGGTTAKALKLTHPDRGGSAADLQRTLRARDTLSRLG